MISTRFISILGVVTEPEQVVVEAAASLLAQALSGASSETWTCQCRFSPDLSAIAGTAAGSVVVTSLQVPLTTQLEKPWSEVERDLRNSYARLCKAGEPVMICTILRHVAILEDSDRARRTLRRIRQLNLLATELSRQYGALIIDLDRVLADIGARRLNTDYRLASTKAIDVASNAIALSIATNALDTFASVQLQDAARSVLNNSQPALGLSAEIRMTNVISLGHGRRKQLVSTVTDSVQEKHAGWLVRQVLTGRISTREALARLVQAVRNRGAAESAALLISGIVRLFKTQS